MCDGRVAEHALDVGLGDGNDITDEQRQDCDDHDHVGPDIVGEMGYRRATSLTAIGDAVNVASRLDTLTKEFNSQLVVSARLARLAGVNLGAFDGQDIDIRGRRRPLRIHIVTDATSLPGSSGAWRQSSMPKFSMTRLLPRMKRP